MTRIERKSLTTELVEQRLVAALKSGHRVESGVTHWGREVSYQVALEARQPPQLPAPELADPGVYVVRFWERDQATPGARDAVPVKAQGQVCARLDVVEAVRAFLQLAGPFVQIVDPEESEAAE